ncbi:hypothetical protein PybrP1_006014 [[Pythium] brassicae (nom. inval.)]|nr:hypothetical protein PybrP1_006014 [[Pythium] brassicae (nom. inval.)]
MGAAASDYFTPYADIQYGFLDAELALEDLHELAAKGKYHRVSIRLKNGMDPNGKMFLEDDAFEREDSPMICAARGDLWNKGRKRHLKTLDVLLRFGANVNQWNLLEQTPLYIACDRNLVAIATWLVTHGADANKATKAGVTPLLCAYRNQNDALVRLLLGHGTTVVEPPVRFRCIKFPVLLDEVAAAASDSQATDNAEGDSSDGDSDDVNRKLRRPEKAAAAREFAQRVHDELQKHIEQQCDVRAKMLAEIEDARRIEEQRVYREQLADQGAKRKQQQRETRAKAKYQRYIAKVECKRLEHASLRNASSNFRSRDDRKRLRSKKKLEPTLSTRSMEKTVGQIAHAEALDAGEQIALSKFLKFFRSRLKTHLENVEADFEDTRSDRLSSDEVYSQKDIQEVLQSLCFAVKANVRSELQDTINMMALLLRQIFSEAEARKLALELDIGSIEDRDLLARVERLSVGEWVDADNGGSATVGTLSAAKIKASQAASPTAKEEQLEAQLAAQKEHEAQEVRAALHASKLKDEAHAKEAKKLQRKLDDAREQIDDLERQLEDTQQHIAQTKQFVAMKALVTSKNEQLRATRERLLRYEPNYCDDAGETKSADDDDE